MKSSNIKFFVDRKEIRTYDAEIKIDETKEARKFQTKSYEGTLENVEFGGEFLKFIEKQRKLLKIQKAREELNKYM